MLYDNIMVPYDGIGIGAGGAGRGRALRPRGPGSRASTSVQIVDTEQLVIEKLEKEGRNTPATSSSSVLLHAHYDEALAEADAASRRQYRRPARKA